MTLVFHDPAADPGTHVLIIGVGAYAYGRRSAQPSAVAGDLAQLTSPPRSARATADWFITSFQNRDRPLASVEMLLSEADPQPYVAARPAGEAPVVPAPATFPEVELAAGDWADRLRSNKENMALFYFCGHGVSVGEQAALLLSDFGEPRHEYRGAIAVDELIGTMRNSRAIRQAYLFDCCRTRADTLYLNEPRIGTRIVHQTAFDRGHAESAQQFVLFPTIDGEEAFGAADQPSAFTSALIDALDFAAADLKSGAWRTSTAGLHAAIDQLIGYRVPPQLRTRSKPTAVDSTVFYLNDVGPPATAKSFVTISDATMWSEDVTIECRATGGAAPPLEDRAADHPGVTCCTFDLPQGTWKFTGTLPAPHAAAELEQIVVPPVAYITLAITS
jgi:hypothetical protein